MPQIYSKLNVVFFHPQFQVVYPHVWCWVYVFAYFRFHWIVSGAGVSPQSMYRTEHDICRHIVVVQEPFDHFQSGSIYRVFNAIYTQSAEVSVAVYYIVRQISGAAFHFLAYYFSYFYL